MGGAEGAAALPIVETRMRECGCREKAKAVKLLAWSVK